MACSKVNTSVQPAAQNAAGNVGCKSFESALWDVSYSSLIDAKTAPAQVAMASMVSKSMASLKSKEAQNALAQRMNEFYQIIGVDQIQTESLNAQLTKLTALEIGSTVTPEAQEIQNKLQVWRKNLEQTYQQYDVTCANPEPPTSETPTTPTPTPGQSTEGAALQNQVYWGADKALAVAYQSCATAAQSPMTTATPDLQGITVLGQNGLGTIRKITGLAQFLSSNYYYQNFNLQQSCRDVRTAPMIYNYGGKPATTSAATSALDFFTKTGEGVSPELGIDCSGYVFSSIATAGLRLSPGTQLKAVLVHGVNSTMFMNPSSNGMSCLQKVSMGLSGTLKAGDILAQNGHVVVIDRVGADPLGILSATNDSQCDAITSAKFDFIIAQSSSSKGGIGINKYIGRDYLLEDSTFKSGLEAYAHQACHARFASKDVAVQSSVIQVVRHKLTSDCIQKPVALAGEACVAQCYAASN